MAVLMLTLWMGGTLVPCTGAFGLIEQGYGIANEAYSDSRLAGLKETSRKAMETGQKALTLAEECECPDAKDALLAAYTRWRNATGADGMKEGRYQALCARGPSDRALSAIEECPD
jgi:hypothetical protein